MSNPPSRQQSPSKPLSEFDSDEDDEQYGIANINPNLTETIGCRARGRQMTVGPSSQHCPANKVVKSTHKQDFLVSSRLDQIEGRLSNIEEANREIIKMLKAIQAILPRVLSSSDGGPFQTNTRKTTATAFYMP